MGGGEGVEKDVVVAVEEAGGVGSTFLAPGRPGTIRGRVADAGGVVVLLAGPEEVLPPPAADAFRSRRLRLPVVPLPRPGGGPRCAPGKPLCRAERKEGEISPDSSC